MLPPKHIFLFDDFISILMYTELRKIVSIYRFAKVKIFKSPGEVGHETLQK